MMMMKVGVGLVHIVMLLLVQVALRVQRWGEVTRATRREEAKLMITRG